MRIAFALLCGPLLGWAQFYNISTIAGIGRQPFTAGLAINARLVQPRGVVADAAGNIYVTDWYYHQVFRISGSGTISVYAGNGQPGFSGDGGPATAAQLFDPQGLAVDPAGNLYIADFGNSRVRKVSPDGTIKTVVAIGGPYGLALDAAGNLYISQVNQHVIRMVDPARAITTIAGTGTPGYSGDGGQATAAMLFNPEGLAVDKSGNVYVADNFNNRVRKITPQGAITTFAGNGNTTAAGDGSAATSASVWLPADVALDSTGNLYIADGNGRVRRVNTGGIISTLAGGGNSFQDGPADQADLLGLNNVAVDSQGNILVTLGTIRQVRRVTLQQTITTIAGVLPSATGGDNVAATSATLLDPFGIAADSAGNIYVSDLADNRVRKLSAAGIITTVTGNGLPGSTGDGGPAGNAEVGTPRGLGFDPAGNLYVASGFGAVVRRVSANGTISTIAGTGGAGYSGDGGKAALAQLSAPFDAVGDTAGNVYIADARNARIRRIDASGIITTLAGTGVEGYSGDNGPAQQAQLFQPRQLAVDKNGNLYVADQSNHRIRKISASGTITTVAGNGQTGTAGDGAAATAAQVGGPTGVAVDAAGNLYIAHPNRIRKVDASTGTIATIAGTAGDIGFSGDSGLATLAILAGPQSLALDGAGNIYFTDELNLRARKLTPVQIVKEGVANGATLKAGPVAPGEILTIYFGSNLGPSTPVGLQLDASGRVATQLAGMQVLFDGLPAPILFVSGSQINVVAPYGIAGSSSTQVQVMVQGKPTNTITLSVVASSPGLFAITNQDGSVNSPSNPAAAGSVLVLYGTGEGQTDPPGVDGNVSTSVFPKPLLPVSVQIGGQNASILYQGAAPGFVSGVLQVNVQIPAGLHGAVPLQLQIGNASTPSGLSISVQ